MQPCTLSVQANMYQCGQLKECEKDFIRRENYTKKERKKEEKLISDAKRQPETEMDKKTNS